MNLLEEGNLKILTAQTQEHLRKAQDIYLHHTIYARIEIDHKHSQKILA